MKQHTQRFKEAITELGKQQSVLITYTIDNEEVILGVEEINSATPRYDADLLKSVMKELHLDSNVDIPVGTEINFKYGLLVDGEFEYLDYGNYIVYTSEKKEDTSSYEILCYDKMLYAMKEYEELNIRYPCTVMQYINAIATKMGLKVSSNNNKFPNYNTEIAGEFYLSIDEETKGRTSLGYTYRDILDDLAEVTASVICINEYDELEVRDIKDAINYKTTEKSKELKIESQLEAPIQLVTLDGASTQETRSGKNLLQTQDTNGTLNGVEYTISNGILILNGTATADTNIKLSNTISKILQAGSYAFSKYVISGTMTPINFNLLARPTNNYYGALASADSQQVNIESDFEVTSWQLYFKSGSVFNNYKVKFQVEKGEATEYEQYGASPSPEYPSEIKSVGDDVNLFDKNTAIQGYIDYNNGQFTSISTYTSSDFIEINGNTNYYCNYIVYNSTSYGMAFYDKDKNYISGSVLASSFVTPSNAKYYRFCVRNENYNGNYITDINTIKLQKGTVATPYSEYGKGTVEIKQRGENLIPFPYYDGTSKEQNGITYIVNNDGTIKVNGTATANTRFVLYEGNGINVKKGFVTLSGITGGSATTYYLQIYIDKVYRSAMTSGFKSYETNDNEKVTTVDFTVKAGTTLNNLIIKPQLEFGELATEYEPYKENNYVIPLSQPLRSLPNGVKDTIEEDGIHRRVGSVTVNIHTITTLRNGNIGGIANLTNKIANYEENVICSKAVAIRSFEENTVYINISNAVFVGNPTDTLETIKEKFDGAEIIYELAEEVIEPFDEEQQAVIDSIETFEGVNIISSNTELQIRYAIDQDTIDEEYLKDTNVNFGEVFGPVNAVVLSRSSSDNIYRNDVASINQNGLYEIKISDNQIMNQNNRDTFIQAIFDKLKGLTYGICDFSSTGIMYYDLLDRFNVKVGDNTYSIVMFHDEQNITQGLEENIFAEKPERSETDYTKADKTDQKLNQTNLIVDKQNQQISALVSSNTALEQKTAQLIIDVEGIKGQISDVADVTTTAEGYGTAELDNISGDSEPIYLRVYPTNEDILSLKPSIGLYPRVGLYSHSREIYIKNTSSQEPYQLIYNIPSDLYQLDGVYDEFVLTFEAKECYVIHRIGINENGEKYLLETETIESFDYPNLPLTEGDYQIYTPAFNMAYIYVRLMAKNIYTDQFATKVELKSTVEQTATDITTSVDKKLTNYDTKTEVNSKISQTANDITSTVSQTYETKSNANRKYSEIKQTTDSISSTVSKKVGNDEIISKINQSAEAVQINANKISLERKRT